MSRYTSEQALIGAVNGLVDMMWPGGTLYYTLPEYKEWVEPTGEEMAETQIKAEDLLVNAIDAYVPMLGRPYCVKGATKFFEFLQVDALVQHLGYSLLDQLVRQILPGTSSGIEKLHVDLATRIRREQNEIKNQRFRESLQENSQMIDA
eukprot:CAMPEP_0170186204 /NCGR_PEP_ID=MMETSP0040_2-20121228/38517_1 /TAXON_ID=641309 /ORGANISM="Lotharella oceanica, Strain CCMP622" /LENGTH=148 /DNA_ID=CAMNT_0010432865 /DNA_START=43 /DNA_END=492 /DNA_ORIENTATION=-